jgi:UDP-glucose:(heptosyl)LPS alpha-1,3-glucosyltransferase
MAPRIAIIRQRYNAAGGAERFVSRAIAALGREGAEVTLIARRWDTPLEDANRVVLDPFFIGRTWRDWSFARAVRAHLARHRYDLVQSHERLEHCDVYRAGDGVHREWLLQRSRALGPLRRSSLWWNPHHRYLLARERRIFAPAGAGAIVCISRMVRDEIVRHYGTAQDRLHVVYLGVDLERYHPAERLRLRSAQRRALALAEDDLALVCVGSGFERKGVATLLDALVRAPGCHLIVVGGDKHEARYRARADELGVAARVRFVGVQKDARAFYAAGDAFAMPSLYEPFGNANMEALAMGLPVITSTKSGVAELLEQGVTGFVHDAMDAAGFARSIDTLRDRPRRERMGHAARSLAEGYSLESMTRSLLALYEQLMRKRS